MLLYLYGTILLYLTCNGVISYFYDYCILGVKTFVNYISYFYLLKSQNLSIKILSILIPLSLIGLFIYTIIFTPRTKKKQCLYIMFAYGIASFVVTFPISDNIHFLIGSLPTIICIIYIAYNFIEKQLNRKYMQKFYKPFYIAFLSCFTGTLIFILFIYSIVSIDLYMVSAKHYKELENFKYIPISENLVKTIKNIDEYIIKNEKVYILDAEAAIYMIPINRYNKDYDMFLKGNLGSKGEDGQIEKIKNEDALFLIMKDKYTRNWQNPEKVRKYIKQNMEKVDEFMHYDVYTNR